MMNELLKCPFCGSEKIETRIEKARKGVFEGYEYAWAQCCRCNARGPHAWATNTDQESSVYAINQWNERLDWMTGEKIEYDLSDM